MNSTTPQSRPWICAQIGAREHYAIPRVLARQQKLERLMTDYWWPPSKLLPPRAAGRWHPELSHVQVLDLNWQGLINDGLAGLRDTRGWAGILARNDWFQQAHLARLQRDRKRLRALPAGVFFTYSYAARSLLRFFRDLGWKTLLGQIDPGPHEARIVAREIECNSQYQSRWRPPPENYWDNLRAEHELADLILVNSAWSRRLCMEAGVAEDKLRILPLAYENTDQECQPVPAEKHYPDRFDSNRPLRVLFLGHLTPRKGIYSVLESIQELAEEAVEFWLVGARDIQVSDEFSRHPRIIWTGAVSRARAADYYARADVFILPTLSDGFALTQLEAQAWRLPVIATRHCAEVVHDGVNGLIIDPINAQQLSACLRRCLREPGLLACLSRASRVADEFSLEALVRRLEALEVD